MDELNEKLDGMFGEYVKAMTQDGAESEDERSDDIGDVTAATEIRETGCDVISEKIDDISDVTAESETANAEYGDVSERLDRVGDVTGERELHNAEGDESLNRADGASEANTSENEKMCNCCKYADYEYDPRKNYCKTCKDDGGADCRQSYPCEFRADRQLPCPCGGGVVCQPSCRLAARCSEINACELFCVTLLCMRCLMRW